MPSVGTHSGTFHCDEALGCFLLQQTPQYKDAAVTRSRDPAVLDKLDIVIDVGGTYEPGMLSTLESQGASPSISTKLWLESLAKKTNSAERQRYDHHQRGFAETFGHGEVPTQIPSAEASQC